MILVMLNLFQHPPQGSGQAAEWTPAFAGVTE